jgi:hypothetical protein
MGLTHNPRPAQPDAQFRSAFSFAPPTAPNNPTDSYQGCVHFRRCAVHVVEHCSVIISNIIAITIIANVIIIIIIIMTNFTSFYGMPTPTEACTTQVCKSEY